MHTQLVELGATRARIRVRGFPLHPEAQLIQLYQGVLAHYGFEHAKVKVTLHAPTDLEIALDRG